MQRVSLYILRDCGIVLVCVCEKARRKWSSAIRMLFISRISTLLSLAAGSAEFLLWIATSLFCFLSARAPGRCYSSLLADRRAVAETLARKMGHLLRKIASRARISEVLCENAQVCAAFLRRARWRCRTTYTDTDVLFLRLVFFSLFASHASWLYPDGLHSIMHMNTSVVFVLQNNSIRAWV